MTPAQPDEHDDCAALCVLTGAAELPITPTRDRSRVHDDTYVRALIVDDGTTRIAIMTSDLGGLSGETSFELIDNIQAAIEKETGIPIENQMINCSHTHNAPWPPDDVVWEDGSNYVDWMTGRFAEVAAIACRNMTQSMVFVDHKLTQVAFNRRLMQKDGYVGMEINPLGAMVPHVDILAAYATENMKRIALLFAYPAHPVIVHTSSDLITADLPGATISALKDILSANGKGDMDGVLMYAQGCGGNVNAFPVRGGHEACAAVGKAFANAIVKADLQQVGQGPIHVRSLELMLPVADLPTVAECERFLAERPNELYERLLQRARQGVEHRELPYPMRAIALGPDLCILSTPRETFVEYQLHAIEASPFEHTVVFGYTNGTGHYVGTRADYELGIRSGHETSPIQSNAFDPSVEDIVKDGVITLLNDLNADVSRSHVPSGAGPR